LKEYRVCVFDTDQSELVDCFMEAESENEACKIADELLRITASRTSRFPEMAALGFIAKGRIERLPER